MQNILFQGGELAELDHGDSPHGQGADDVEAGSWREDELVLRESAVGSDGPGGEDVVDGEESAAALPEEAAHCVEVTRGRHHPVLSECVVFRVLHRIQRLHIPRDPAIEILVRQARGDLFERGEEVVEVEFPLPADRSVAAVQLAVQIHVDGGVTRSPLASVEVDGEELFLRHEGGLLPPSYQLLLIQCLVLCQPALLVTSVLRIVKERRPVVTLEPTDH